MSDEKDRKRTMVLISIRNLIEVVVYAYKNALTTVYL